ncbi:metallophosphoesterase [Helicobacter typhlonius]|uniref:metallophosphoesterase n=1 Tax=Helicobacter typhlonius TaxID=76936 RepID=UPI002FE1AFCB
MNPLSQTKQDSTIILDSKIEPFSQLAHFWENAPLIYNDAIFIADSHFMPLNTTLNDESKNASIALLNYFKSLLDSVQNIPSQIFLMGDIAHLLFGGISSSHKTHKELLELIISLSAHSQIWWFEGNHDFNLVWIGALKKHFNRIFIVPRNDQPKAFLFKSNGAKKRILLAHGDLFLNTKYELYIRCMRTQFLQFCMRFIDFVTFGNLYHNIIAKVNRKHIRVGKAQMSEFAPLRICAYEKYMRKKLNIDDLVNLDSIFDAVIEGHFHIGQTYSNGAVYVSLPSFYINGSIFAIQSLPDNKIT